MSVKQRKAGLRDSQVRILKALQKASNPIPRNRINELVAEMFPTFTTAKKGLMGWMSEPLGRIDEEGRREAEWRSGYPSLLTLGMVEAKKLDVEGKVETVYGLTQEGRIALLTL